MSTSQDVPVGLRDVNIAEGSISTYFLSTFGRASRETVCSCEVKLEPTLSQSLHLLNGDTTTQKIAGGGLIAKRLTEKKTPEQIIEELYVRCVARKPTTAEMAKLSGLIAPIPDKKQALEDVFWSLL